MEINRLKFEGVGKRNTILIYKVRRKQGKLEIGGI
jgi:hypothetical protein